MLSFSRGNDGFYPWFSKKKVLDHADPLNVQLLIVVNVKIFKFLSKNIKMLLVVMQDVQLKEKDFHWKS